MLISPKIIGRFAGPTLAVSIALALSCASNEPSKTQADAGSSGLGAAGAVSGGASGTSASGGTAGSGFVGQGGAAGVGGRAGAGQGGLPAGGFGGTAGASPSGGAAGMSGSAGTGGMGAGAGGAGLAGTGGGGRGGGGGSAGAAPTIVETLDVEDVWAGQPVNFALVTRGDRQFLAYYDAARNMRVASRTLGSTTWTFATLPTVLGWDSHNHVAMAIDSTGQIHVAGNMHGVPLIYFRTSQALNVTTFSRIAQMVGTNEATCTYPEFFRGPSGNLVFMYRDGASGSGNHIFNTLNATTEAWSRLLGTPLTDGQGARNAYPVGPIQGADGTWHLVWVWRDTPDASTNHDLSYAKTQNLTSWQAGGGRALALPITLATSDIVDPVPVNGGMINNNTKVGFDAEGRPVVGYHKYDANGYTQLYNARLEGGVWVVHRTTDWTYRWVFGGQGTLVFAIELDGVRVRSDGALVQDFYHSQYGGRGTLRLDPTTLHVVETLPPDLPYPRALDTPEATTAGMVVRWTKDAGAGPDTAVHYMLRWETLESNRDMPRDPAPPPTRLRLYGFR